MDLRFADEPQRYNCATCEVRTQELRKCHQDRNDFGPNDAAFFPIYLRRDSKKQPVGVGYGFCPGKATWYPATQQLFDLLVLAAETGQPLYSGGLAEQPGWAAEAMAWFIPEYRDLQFNKRARAVFGSGEEKEPARGPDNRRPSR